MMKQDVPHRASGVLRLLQLSPLIAAALLAVIWFGVPSGLRGAVITATAEQQRNPSFDSAQERAVSWYYRRGQPPEEGSLQPQLLDAAKDVWKACLPHRRFFLGDRLRSPDFRADDGRFRSLREFERQTGATVYAWILTPDVRPPVVASATPLPEYLPSIRHAAPGAKASDPLSIVWLSSHGPDLGKYPPVNWTAVRANAKSGTDDGERTYIVEGVQRLAGKWWWFVWTGPKTDSDGPEFPPEIPAELLESEPGAPAFQRLVEKESRKTGWNLFVSGPKVYDAVPLRKPGDADALALGRRLWPDTLALTPRYTQTPEPLDSTLAEVAKGRYALSAFVGGDECPELLGPGGPGKDSPQTMMFFAVWPNDPMSGGPLLRFRVWHAANLSWLLGLGAALLGVTLVASPTAFVLERRRRLRRVAQEELARVQRDAHDRVYNRLSALSKQVETASDDITGSTQRRLDDLAEDIRGTVEDLQQILGDEPRRDPPSV